MPIILPGEELPGGGEGGGPVFGGGLPLVTDDDLYDLWLGPLAFTWPRDVVEETLGDTLEAIGAALTPAERRPRPVKVPLLIEGNLADTPDARAVGYRLRRQVRQLLENADWLAHGLYLWWRADDELAGWVRVGGGGIRESDPGVSFGIWELELESAYLVGRPATERPGRRLDLADRRTGLVPRDTRGRIYSTEYADYDLAFTDVDTPPFEALILPGDVSGLLSSARRPITATPGPTREDGHRLYQAIDGVDGEVVSYDASPAAFPDEPSAYVTLDAPGSVRAWDLSAAVTYPPVQADYTTAGDQAPDDIYAWEAVYGAQLTSSSAPLAIDNGLIRLIWLGTDTDEHALAFEWFDEDLDTFRREGVIGIDQAGAFKASVVELTPERAVIEWRFGVKCMRAILQRGWMHARLESYSDDGDDATLSYRSDVGDIADAVDADVAWVRVFTAAARTLYWAPAGPADLYFADADVVLHQNVLAVAAQFGAPTSSAHDVARWSLVDARSVPVLLSRSA